MWIANKTASAADFREVAAEEFRVRCIGWNDKERRRDPGLSYGRVGPESELVRGLGTKGCLERLGAFDREVSQILQLREAPSTQT